MKYLRLILRPATLGRVVFVFLLTGVMSLVAGPKVEASTTALPDTGTHESCVVVLPAYSRAVIVGDNLTITCVYTTTGWTSATASGTRTLNEVPGTPWFKTGVNYASWNTAMRNSYTRFSTTSTTVNPSDCPVRCMRWVIEVTLNPLLGASNYPAGQTDWPETWRFNTYGTATLGGVGSTGLASAKRFTTDPHVGTPFSFGSSIYSPPPANLCEGINIGFELDSDALVVGDYDETFLPRLSDDLVAVLTVPGLDADEVHDVLSFEYRWGTANDFGSVIPIDTVDVVGGSAFTFKPRSFSDQYLSQLVIRCDDGGGDGFRFFYGEDPGPSISDTLWSETAPFYGACSNMFVTLPSPAFDIEAGDVVNVPYELSGDEGVDVEVYGAGWTGGFSSGKVEVASYSLIGVQTGGPSPFTHSVAPGRGVLRFTVPSIIPGEFVDGVNSTLDLGFYCSDGYGEDGTRVPGSLGQSFSATLGGDVDAAASCWNTSNMSLTSPSSWIAGSARMLGCLARELFVPDSGELLESLSSANSTIEERPPFVIVYVLLDFGQDVSEVYEERSGSGCFDVAIPVAGVDPGESCVGDGLTVSGGQRSILATLLIAPMLLGLISHSVSLVRAR